MSIKGAIKDVSKMDDILTPKEVEKKYSWSVILNVAKKTRGVLSFSI